MPTAFRKFLIFNVTTDETSTLEFTNCPRHIFRSAKSRIRINNCRNVHRACNVPSELRHFSEREQPNVRHARCRICHSRAADINGLKSGLLHLPRHRRVRHARERHRAV